MEKDSGRTHPAIEVKNLTMAFNDRIIQKDLSFTINRGDVFIIIGTSGCGKSTLMRHMIGLNRPAEGEVYYDGVDFWNLPPPQRQQLMRRFGVLYQGGALWSSMTLAENVALPLEEYTELTRNEIADLVTFKLALVGLVGFGNYYPNEISGGMKKRAGLARAMALDPEILFFDEPSGGLDPLNSRMLDDLILELRDSLGATLVVVTHELASIFAIGSNSVFLDAKSRTMIAAGDPGRLLAESDDPRVQSFLTRGESNPATNDHTPQGGPS
ncbi:MAG: ATP-binding cassette domain-containing protein [Desulfuromonadales bacterium]